MTFPKNRIAGHGLIGEGIPHDDNGEPVASSEGRALCRCGARSDVRKSTAARKRWHREHKAVITAGLPQVPAPVTAAPIKESVVEKHLLSQCREVGFLCYKFTSPAKSGVPDRVVITPAGTVFVELKRPAQGDARRLQLAQHDKMRRHGAAVVVLNTRESVDRFIAHVQAGINGQAAA